MSCFEIWSHPVLALTRTPTAELLLPVGHAFGVRACLARWPMPPCARSARQCPGLSLASPMTKRKPIRRLRARSMARLAGIALTLAAGVSLHSCAELPAKRELLAAGAQLQALLTSLGTAVRQQVG